MIRWLHLAIALGLFSVSMGAQDEPLAWFPLRVGSRWVYEHEWKSGERSRPTVERWTTEESIAGWVTVPEGLVVLREAKRRSGQSGQPATGRVLGLDGRVREAQTEADGGYLVARDREPYLVRGNCIYVMDDGFDSRTRELRPAYRKYLAEGAVPPDFCFPLEVGRKWGNTEIPWRVEPARGNEYGGAAHIISDHFGSGGWMDVWFQKGAGVVGEHYIHNGSYDEYTKRLISFLP